MKWNNMVTFIDSILAIICLGIIAMVVYGTVRLERTKNNFIIEVQQDELGHCVKRIRDTEIRLVYSKDTLVCIWVGEQPYTPDTSKYLWY